MPKEKKPNEGVAILTVNGYMQKYAIDGIGKGADREMIREQLLDAFRKEIFDTAMIMVNPMVFANDYEVTEKDRLKLDNIIKNANNKWKSLCKEFSKYKETCNLIYEDDLMKHLDDRNEELKKKESVEYYTDEEFEEATTEKDQAPEEEVSDESDGSSTNETE
jgi:hypothetical protein